MGFFNTKETKEMKRRRERRRGKNGSGNQEIRPDCMSDSGARGRDTGGWERRILKRRERS
jgi:hypothetical protein